MKILNYPATCFDPLGVIFKLILGSIKCKVVFLTVVNLLLLFRQLKGMHEIRAEVATDIFFPKRRSHRSSHSPHHGRHTQPQKTRGQPSENDDEILLYVFACIKIVIC